MATMRSPKVYTRRVTLEPRQLRAQQQHWHRPPTQQHAQASMKERTAKQRNEAIEPFWTMKVWGVWKGKIPRSFQIFKPLHLFSLSLFPLLLFSFKETDWRKESSGSLQVVFLSCSFEFFQLLFQLLSFMIEGKFLPSVPFQVQVLSCVPFQALWSSFERSFSSLSSSQWIWG